MNRRVYQLVRDKRAWEGPPEPAEAEDGQSLGAKGWYTRGYLPHYDQPGTLQMVTFRLADALPAARRREWEALFAVEDGREQRTRIEAYLDRGLGACHLRDPRVAASVEAVLLYGDGRHYRLAAWVVMPNHVHALVELWTLPLGRLIQAWKGTSARDANRLLGRPGTFWQTEYWDRYLRDEEHFRKAQRYIEGNPVKAHLARRPEDWPFSSAHPKWQWSGTDRYRGAQLLNPGPRRVSREEQKAREAEGRQECRRSDGEEGARTFLSATTEIEQGNGGRQECRRSHPRTEA